MGIPAGCGTKPGSESGVNNARLPTEALDYVEYGAGRECPF